jgi:hypothetical protein
VEGVAVERRHFARRRRYAVGRDPLGLIGSLS